MSAAAISYRFSALPGESAYSDVVLESDIPYVLREAGHELEITLHVAGKTGYSICLHVPDSDDRIFPVSLLTEASDLLTTIAPSLGQKLEEIQQAFLDFDHSELTDRQQEKLKKRLNIEEWDFSGIIFFGYISSNGISALEVDINMKPFPFPEGTDLHERVRQFIANVLANPPEPKPAETAAPAN